MRISRAVSALFLILLTAATAQSTDTDATNTFPVSAFGAEADDNLPDTEEIQAAIDACSAAGGGEVVIEKGHYLAAFLRLRDNVMLVVEEGAVLQAIEDATTYEESTWIQAKQIMNSGIRGAGTIIGNGSTYFRPTSGRLRSLVKALFTSRNLESPFTNLDAPFRYSIRFQQCTNVTVQDLTILDSPGWTLHLLASQNILIQHVTIINKVYGPHTDGINIDSSSNVIVRDCNVTAGNDAYCVKSSNIRRMPRPSGNILFENCLARTPTNGFKIGTDTRADITQVTFRDCRVEPPLPGLLPLSGINISCADGANVSQITAEGIELEAVQVPFLIRLGNRGRGMPDDARIPGTLSQIRMRDIAVGVCTQPIVISGIDGHRVKEVSLQDITIHRRLGRIATRAAEEVPELPRKYPHPLMFGPLPAWGLFSRHVEGLTVENVQVSPPAAISSLSSGIDVIAKSGELTSHPRTLAWQNLYWALTWMLAAAAAWHWRWYQHGLRRQIGTHAVFALVCIFIANLAQIWTGHWQWTIWMSLMKEPYVLTFIVQALGMILLLICGFRLWRLNRRAVAADAESPSAPEAAETQM